MNWKLLFGLFLGCVIGLGLWAGIYELYKMEPEATVVGLGLGFLWLGHVIVKEIVLREEAPEGDRLDRPVRRRAGSGLDPWDLGMGDD